MTESQNTEYKSSWHDDHLKWICGFANANGGVIFVGKDDSGKVVGVSNSKRLMEEIPNKVRDLLGITVEVNLHHQEDFDFIEVIVSPSTVAISLRSRFYFRSGSTNRELTGQSLSEFLLKKTGKSWDDVEESDFSLDEINITAIEYFKKEAVRSKRLAFLQEEEDTLNILLNLNLVKKQEFKRAAVLLFAKNPCKYFVQAYAKIGRFGISDSDLLSQEVIEGNILQMPDRIIEILENKYFVNLISYEGLHRRETPPYPYEALREIIINAVIHRDYTGPFIQISLYDDKIIFWNYGGLPPDLSISELSKKHVSRPRNPLLAEVFFKAGLIEAWGRGTIKIIEECSKHGLPEPEFGLMSGGFYVTLFKDQFTEKYLSQHGLNERQIKIMQYLKSKGSITNSQYQKINNVGKTTSTLELQALVDKEFLKKDGSVGKGTKYLLSI